MPRDIIVVGASIGGIETIQTLLRGLPGDLAASIFIVQHTSADSPGVLQQIFQRATALRVVTVQEVQPIEPSVVYVVKPDHHLVIEPGIVCATHGPKENRFRPAIDPLFRSAAVAYRERVIGVILSGGLYDGTAGLGVIKDAGGIAVVQDPREAISSSMPLSAIASVPVDHIVSATQMPELLTRLTREPVMERSSQPISADVLLEVQIARGSDPIRAGVFELGEPSKYACPECHGVLLRLKRASVPGFRCHAGHAYSLPALAADLGDGVQTALWNALRAVQEYAILSAHLEQHGRQENNSEVIVQAQTALTEAKRQEAHLRAALGLHEEGPK